MHQPTFELSTSWKCTTSIRNAKFDEWFVHTLNLSLIRMRVLRVKTGFNRDVISQLRWVYCYLDVSWDIRTVSVMTLLLLFTKKGTIDQARVNWIRISFSQVWDWIRNNSEPYQIKLNVKIYHGTVENAEFSLAEWVDWMRRGNWEERRQSYGYPSLHL